MANLRSKKRGLSEGAGTWLPRMGDAPAAPPGSDRVATYLAVLPTAPNQSNQDLQLQRPLALFSAFCFGNASDARALHH